MPGNSHNAEYIKLAIETMVLFEKFILMLFIDLHPPQIDNFNLENADKISTRVTDQGSNFVYSLKQKLNKFIDEENSELPNIENFERELDEICDEVREIKDSQNSNTEEVNCGETSIEDDFKQEEGGKIVYIDDIKDNEEENSFTVNSGQFIY